jgi:hypothetical protein
MASNRYLVNIPPKVWTVLGFWFHVAAGGVLTEFIVHHTTSVKALGGAALAALAPVLYRYFNPADTFPAPAPSLAAADAAVKGTTPPTA